MLTLLLNHWRALSRRPLLWGLFAGFVMLATFFFLLQLEHYQHVRPLLHRQENPPSASDLILVPWIFNTALALMVLVPMLCGRAFVAEYRQGLLPLMLGWSVPALKWILTRWLGWLLPLSLLVLLLASLPLSLVLAGPVDIGRMWPSLLALWLVVAAFSATATALSAWIRDPAMASLASFLLLLLLWILDWSARAQGVDTDEAIFSLSLFEHFRRMNAGLIYAQDLSWFASFIGLMLLLGAWPLARFTQGWIRPLRWLLPLLALWLAGWQIPARSGWVADTSWQHRLSLSPITRNLLNQIEKPVQITAWASADSKLRQQIRHFLAPWQRQQPLLHLQFRDPKTDPDTARSLAIRADGTLILQQGKHSERLERTLDERALAQSLWRLLLQPHGPVVVLQCEGCADIHDSTPAGYSHLAEELRLRGLSVLPLNPEKSAGIPLSTRLLLIAGTPKNLSQRWWQELDPWLQQGGNLLWLTDVEAQKAVPAIWEPWGLHVLDAFPNKLLPVEATHASVPHPPALPGPLTWSEATSGGWQTLWNCRQQACALAREQVLPNGRHGRILLLGDSDLARNRWFDEEGYASSLLQLVGWLNEANTLFTLPVLQAPDTGLELPPEMQARFGLYGLVLLPALLLVTGWLLRLKPCRIIRSAHVHQD